MGCKLTFIQDTQNIKTVLLTANFSSFSMTSEVMPKSMTFVKKQNKTKNQNNNTGLVSRWRLPFELFSAQILMSRIDMVVVHLCISNEVLSISFQIISPCYSWLFSRPNFWFRKHKPLWVIKVTSLQWSSMALLLKAKMSSLRNNCACHHGINNHNCWNTWKRQSQT